MKRNKKSLVIGILCITLIFMGLGYSILSSTLTISGTSTANGTFGVSITGVGVDRKSDGVTNLASTTYTTDTVNLNATFMQPGDYITYEITVENTGTIDAMINAAVQGQGQNDEYFDLTCDLDEARPLAAGATDKFYCTMTFDSSAQSLPNTTASLTVTLEVIQNANYVAPPIQYVDQDDTCFISVIPGQINYYNSSCGASVTIPNNLRLKTSAVTSYTIDDEVCEEYAEGEETTCNAVKQEIADIVSTYGYDDPDNGLFVSDYVALIEPSFASPSGDYHDINTIGTYSFIEKGITILSLSNSITDIRPGAFANNSISSLTLPKHLQTIGEFAFTDNLLTGTLTIPKSVTRIDDGAFGSSDGSTNQITSVVFPSGSHLQTIGKYAFIRCAISGSLILPSTLTRIDEGAFAYNNISGTLTIPDSVERIEDLAFYVNNISTLNIGSGLTNLGSYVFSTVRQTINEVNINMTQSTWNSRSLPDTSSYFTGSPTVTYVTEP